MRKVWLGPRLPLKSTAKGTSRTGTRRLGTGYPVTPGDFLPEEIGRTCIKSPMAELTHGRFPTKVTVSLSPQVYEGLTFIADLSMSFFLFQLPYENTIAFIKAWGIISTELMYPQNMSQFTHYTIHFPISKTELLCVCFFQ